MFFINIKFKKKKIITRAKSGFIYNFAYNIILKE